MLVGNVAVFWGLADQASSGAMPLGEVVTVASLAMTVQSIAFGGLNWAMDEAAAPVQAVARLLPADRPRRGAGDPPGGPVAVPATGTGVALEIRDLHFTYPGTDGPIYTGLDLDVRPGESLAVVGSERRRQDHAGQAAVPALRPDRRDDPRRRRRPHPARPRRLAATG